MAILKITNKACYDAISDFEINFIAVKSLGKKILNCIQGRAEFN